MTCLRFCYHASSVRHLFLFCLCGVDFWGGKRLCSTFYFSATKVLESETGERAGWLGSRYTMECPPQRGSKKVSRYKKTSQDREATGKSVLGFSSPCLLLNCHHLLFLHLPSATFALFTQMLLEASSRKSTIPVSCRSAEAGVVPWLRKLEASMLFFREL